MDPDMIRPRKCKPCPPPPPSPRPPPPPSPKKDAPQSPLTSPPHVENVAQACQHDCCKFHEHPLTFLPLAPPPPSPSLWPCHLPPQPPAHVRNYWNDDLDRFSRMQTVESLEMGYRMNFRDPLDDFHEDHTLRRCMASHRNSAGHRQCYGPPPPLLLQHHRGQPPQLLGHHHEPPTSYFPPPRDYGYYQYGYENPNGCTIM